MNLLSEIKKIEKKNGGVRSSSVNYCNLEFNKKYKTSSESSLKYKFGGSFIPGCLYCFDYFQESSKTFIDLSPIGFFSEERVEKTGTKLIFLDLNLVPPKFKVEILSRILEFYSSEIKKNIEMNNPLPIDFRYVSLKKILKGTGFEYAFRGFSRDKIRSPRIVDYSDWPLLVFYNKLRIKGESVNEIYREYGEKRNSLNTQKE